MGFHKTLCMPPTHALSPVIPPNARSLCVTATAGTELVAPYHHRIRTFLMVLAVYTPKGFVPHAASLRHTFVHCGRFVTAASRRSPDSVSVPMWPANLSVRLGVEALVSRYLTNKLIPYRPIPGRIKLCVRNQEAPEDHRVLPEISLCYPRAWGRLAIHYSPVRHYVVRLACLNHAASVQAEPGSNSSILFLVGAFRHQDIKR